MNSNQLRLLSLIFSFSVLLGCKKEKLSEEYSEQNAIEASTSSAILETQQFCGQSLQLQMTDYYPDAFYMNYATILVSNDANNLYLTFNSLYGFDFTKIKLVIGDQAHLQTILGPYVDPPMSVVGPSVPDYSITFPSPVASHTFTIPLSSISNSCFNLYAWAFTEKWQDGYRRDWRSIWIRSSYKINSDPATSYTEYCVQICPPQDCGQLRTQTPGGWGAEPHGNNPGTYLHANFDEVFPTGLTVGSFPGYHVKFEQAQDITDYLPAGGQAKKLTRNYLNPSTFELKNNLVNHLVALTLSVRFDASDAGFGDAGMPLGNMEIGSGAFSGMTVNQFLLIANGVLGGTNNMYSVQDVLSTASAINENYTDGKIDNHYLVCPNVQ